MAKNKHLDFAQLIFEKLVVFISGKKMSSYVPYPLWFSLILAYVGYGLNDDSDDSIAKYTMSSKLINSTPTPVDPSVTWLMEN